MQNRRVIEAGAIVVALALAACAGSGGDAAAAIAGGAGHAGAAQAETPWAFTSDEPEHRPMGDQSVFSGIDVKVEVYEYDDASLTDRETRDYVSGKLSAPPIRLAMLSLVEINGGAAERRVPGLQVFANGEEAPEVGNAASPQQFTFQHQVGDPVRGKRTLMEIRYQGSRFSIGAVPLEVEITSPKADEAVSGDQKLLVRWTGLDAKPLDFWAGCGADEWPSEAIESTQASVTPGVPAVDATTGKPCLPEVIAEWIVESSPQPGTPFRSFRVGRTARRIRRFSVE